MEKLFTDKVALVTGGASGIGRATALAFAREGAHVLVADVAQNGGAETAELVKAEGVDAHFVRTDVTQADQVQAMVDAAMQRWGRLDAAFNNAGVAGLPLNVVDCPEEEWDRVLATNLKSVFLCMKSEIPAMLQGGGGAIVNTSSIAGVRGRANLAAYVAAKHGVVGLTRSAAADFASRNIRVNALLPGSTETPILAAVRHRAGNPDYAASTPIRRIAEPHEQADAVIWLCSSRSSYVVGAALPVDGGLTI